MDTEELEAPVDDIGADIREALAEKVANADVEVPEAPRESERPRGPDGKFLSKEVEATPPPVTVPDAGENAEQPVQQTSAATPPSFLSAEAKAEWAKAPPAIQAAVVKRDADANEGARQWSDQRRQYEQAFAPVQSLSQQYQLPGNEVVSRLVAAEQRLQKDPVGAIIELSQAYGVDLTALVNGTIQPRPAPQFDPNTIPQMVSEQLQAWQQDQALNSQIQTFAGERDQTGLKHPHFANEAVKAHMSALLDKNLATNLQDAYDKAVYAIPEIRTSLLKPAVSQVSKAKRAAVSPSGAPNGSVPAKNGYDAKASIEDDIRESIATLRH